MTGIRSEKDNNMRKQLAGTILAAGTATAALCLAIPAAMAAGTLTVTGGPNFTAVQAPGTTFTLTDTTKNLTFTCTMATAAGTVVDQTHSSNTAVGTVTSSTFGNSAHPCTGPFGSTSTSTQRAGTKMTLNVVTVSSGGVAMGTITNVDHILTISSVLGNCTTEVKGTAGATYTSSSHLLQFTTASDSLKITSTSCSFLAVNDVLTFTSGSGGETVTGSPVAWIGISEP
jgi:hypothetical protein